MARTDDYIKADIISMYDAGVTDLDKIADEVGVARRVVREVLKAAGAEVKSGRVGFWDRVDETTQNQILAEYREGVPTRKICEKFGIPSIPHLYNILALLNESPRTLTPERLNARAAAMDHAVKLYVEQPALTIFEITQETGVNQVTLHQELHRRKIPLKRPHRQWPDD